MTITADREKSVVDAVARELYVGGRWQPAAGGDTFAVQDPATAETIAEVADGTPEDARAALEAAVAMREQWGAHPPRERGEILRRAFERIVKRRDDLALLMTLEMGKPLAESQAEIA